MSPCASKEHSAFEGEGGGAKGHAISHKDWNSSIIQLLASYVGVDFITNGFYFSFSPFPPFPLSPLLFSPLSVLHVHTSIGSCM